MQRVEELADAHRAYAQLFEVCEMQGDAAKLHSMMTRHRVMLPGSHLDLEPSAVAYVFDRWFDQHMSMQGEGMLTLCI